MICFLKGVLHEALPTRVVVEVHGIGYQVEIPLSSYDRLPPAGQEVCLLTHLVVREDAHLLFGFMSLEEKDLFQLLIQRVTGVGPKLALAILSGMSVPRFKVAVVEEDVASLAKISGLGKKTAERIVLELKDRIGVTEAWQAASSQPSQADQAFSDAVMALISLGYRQVEAQKALKSVMDKRDQPGEDSSELVRDALRLLAST
ncbi:MAG: Holliday junction branch migration protein RuvA [Verrucomicrobiales bacterium]